MARNRPQRSFFYLVNDSCAFIFFRNRNRTWNASDFGVVMIKMILTRHNGTRYSLFGCCCFFLCLGIFCVVVFFSSCLILAIIHINKCLFLKMIIDRKSPFFASFDGASFFVPQIQWNAFSVPPIVDEIWPTKIRLTTAKMNIFLFSGKK